MNFEKRILFLFIILLIISIFYLFISLKSNQKKKSPIHTKNILITTFVQPVHQESKVKYSHPKEHMGFPNIQKFNPYTTHKWGGVQRNPVCCRINYTNRGFYDSDTYP
jgi:hypothetical protein